MRQMPHRNNIDAGPRSCKPFVCPIGRFSPTMTDFNPGPGVATILSGSTKKYEINRLCRTKPLEGSN